MCGIKLEGVSMEGYIPPIGEGLGHELSSVIVGAGLTFTQRN